MTNSNKKIILIAIIIIFSGAIEISFNFDVCKQVIANIAISLLVSNTH